MAFGVLAGQITVIFLEVLLGYVGARSGIIKDRDSKFLSDFIMKLLLPCTMLAGAAVDGEKKSGGFKRAETAFRLCKRCDFKLCRQYFFGFRRRGDCYSQSTGWDEYQSKLRFHPYGKSERKASFRKL